MGMNSSIDLTPSARTTILELLARYLPYTETWAYGSRVKWTSKPQSDLDMVVFTTPEQKSAVSALKEAFEESDLPFRVDLFRWDEVPEQFKTNIEVEHVVLQYKRAQKHDQNYKPLGEIVTIKGGKRLPQGNQLQSEPNSHPYIRVRDMGKRYIPHDGLEYVPDNVFPSISRYIVNTNDLIISIVGTIGLVSIIDTFFDQASQTENCAKLSGLDNLDAHYLYYYLISQEGQQEIKAGTVGAVQAKLPLYNIEKIRVYWPDRPIRESIVKILKHFDDKIDLNHQINQTLESMAQAIFQSWFVDFDPVRAKIAALASGGTATDAVHAAMRAISGKTDAQLEQMQREQSDEYARLAHTASLFPSAMQESELGEIPEGWNVSEIGNEVKVVGGGTPSTKQSEFWDGDIYWTTPKDLSGNNEKILLDTERKITVEGLKKISSGLLPVNTVLMSSRAPVGYLALAKVPVAINQGYIAMLCDNVLSPEYVLQWCEANMDDIKQRASGTTFAEISKTAFRPIPVIVPTQTLVDIYSNDVAIFYIKMEQIIREIRALAETRDLLLPKLLSGEIDMTDLDKES